MKNHSLFKVNQHAILLNSNNQFLLLEKDGAWMLPGGRLEPEENWEQGLKREIKEETGIDDFEIKKILFVDISPSGKTYIATFLCQTENDKVSISQEHQDYTWCKGEDIKDLRFQHQEVKKRLVKLDKEP
jgi:ADP-ribose pyrophosphatase YjhB (NUDIX family)